MVSKTVRLHVSTLDRLMAFGDTPELALRNLLARSPPPQDVTENHILTPSGVTICDLDDKAVRRIAKAVAAEVESLVGRGY